MSSFTELLNAALTDPFRIALMVGLVITQRRTAAQTGMALPLVAGVIFIAVILHLTMGFGADAGMAMAVAAGALANALMLVPILFVARIWDNSRH